MGTVSVAEERLRELEALVQEPEASGPDEISELYSEVLELCAEDPERYQRARELGARIAELAQSEVLPRTFVRRGTTRND